MNEWKPVTPTELQRISKSLQDKPTGILITPQPYDNIAFINCPHCGSSDLMIHELMSEQYEFPVFDCSHCCQFSADHTLEGFFKETSGDKWYD